MEIISNPGDPNRRYYIVHPTEIDQIKTCKTIIMKSLRSSVPVGSLMMFRLPVGTPAAFHYVGLEFLLSIVCRPPPPLRIHPRRCRNFRPRTGPLGAPGRLSEQHCR